MSKKMNRIAFASLVAAVAGIVCTPAFAQFQERKIRLALVLGKAHPLGVGVAKMAQCAAEKSGGKLKITGYFDGTLGSDVTASQQLRTGSLEMQVVATAPLVGAIPQLAVFDLPFLFSNEKEADVLLDGKVGESFTPKFASAGLVNLSYWDNGFRNVTNSKRPVTRWEDMHGVKMRVMQNKVYVDMFGALGSNAVPMAFSELYSALETKTVDGQENSVAIIENTKLYEVQKYLSLTRHAYSPAVVLYSKKLFDKLSADEQKALRDCANVGRDESRSVGRSQEARTLEALKRDGLQVNEISPAELARMRERVMPVFDAQVKIIGEETVNSVMTELARIRSVK